MSEQVSFNRSLQSRSPELKPKFKPVLVKQLLADLDSDDENDSLNSNLEKSSNENSNSDDATVIPDKPDGVTVKHVDPGSDDVKLEPLEMMESDSQTLMSLKKEEEQVVEHVHTTIKSEPDEDTIAPLKKVPFELKKRNSLLETRDSSLDLKPKTSNSNVLRDVCNRSDNWLTPMQKQSSLSRSYLRTPVDNKPEMFAKSEDLRYNRKGRTDMRPLLDIKHSVEKNRVFQPKSLNCQLSSVAPSSSVPVSENKNSEEVQRHTSSENRKSSRYSSEVLSKPKEVEHVNRPVSNPVHQPTVNIKENRIIYVKNRPYMELGVIGQGMSCNVYRAQDLVNQELRAIKCVDLSKMDKEAAHGCLQEICLLSKLQDSCIIKMYDFEIKKNSLFVVLELGDTDLSRLLKSMLQEKKPLTLSMIIYYWTEMLTAVNYIHKNGVIHSDLKPANFLLVRGRLKLIDFGIASNLNSDMTSVVKNSTIGTLNYISPEALMDVNSGNNDSPDHNVKYKISFKSDVWSLGCILYGLVYGQTPFQNIRQQWVKINAITDPKHKFTFPTETKTDMVPAILIDVMRKCLLHDPKARPTVSQLLEISYYKSNQDTHSRTPKFSPSILMKLKSKLSESEWEEFSNELKNYCENL